MATKTIEISGKWYVVRETGVAYATGIGGGTRSRQAARAAVDHEYWDQHDEKYVASKGVATSFDSEDAAQECLADNRSKIDGALPAEY